MRDDKIIQAERLAKNGQPELAVEALSQLLDERLDMDEAQRTAIRHRRAKFLGAAARYQDALREFNDLLRLELPLEERINLNYEVAKYTQLAGDVSRARERYSDIGQIYGKENPYVWGVYWAELRLAAINHRRGFQEQAVAVYEKLVKDKGLENALVDKPYELGAVYLFVSSDLLVMKRYEVAARVLDRFLSKEATWPLEEVDLILLGKLEQVRVCLHLKQVNEARSKLSGLLDQRNYRRTAAFVDYAVLLDRLSKAELQLLEMQDKVEEFLERIAGNEALIDKSKRRNLNLLYPDPSLGLSSLCSQ